MFNWGLLDGLKALRFPRLGSEPVIFLFSFIFVHFTTEQQSEGPINFLKGNGIHFFRHFLSPVAYTMKIF